MTQTNPESNLAAEFRALSDVLQGVGQGLRGDVVELKEQQARKVDAVRYAVDNAHTWQRRFMATAIALLLLLGLGVLGLFRNQRTMIDIQRQGRANGAYIRDCTTPGGKCYQRGQAQTGKVVGSLNQTTIAAAHCARITNNDLAALEACVRDTLASATKN